MRLEAAEGRAEAAEGRAEAAEGRAEAEDPEWRAEASSGGELSKLVILSHCDRRKVVKRSVVRSGVFGVGMSVSAS